MNYLHLRSWYYQGEGGNINAHDAFGKLQDGIKTGVKFPFDCPYQVSLVHCQAYESHWCIGVLVIRETQGDDSVEQSEKLSKWFDECGANFSGTENDWDRMTHPSVEGTLQSRYPKGHYKNVEAFGTLPSSATINDHEKLVQNATLTGQSTKPKHNSIAMLFYDNDSQARSGFAKITEACNSISGLTQELVGTAFELRIAPTSVRIIAIRAVDDNKRNQALEFAGALGVFGDSKPQGTQQNNPNANSYSEFDELLNKCTTIQIINFDELPKAKPRKCIVCNGTGQLQYKNPHTEWQIYHHCQFCGGASFSENESPVSQVNFVSIISALKNKVFSSLAIIKNFISGKI